MIKVAVIASIYNGETVEHAKEFFDSLTRQTYQNFALLICHDGLLSVELSELINDYKNKIEIIECRNKTQSGLAASLNSLIEIALDKNEYKYILRMDTDDICFDDRFERQINFMEMNPIISVSGGWCIEFNTDTGKRFLKKMESEDILLKKDIIKKTPFIHPSVIFRINVFANGFRYNTKTHLSEDLLLWFDLAGAGHKFANLDAPLIYYRTSERMLKRRRGIQKACSELKVRMYGINKLNVLNCRNVFFTISYFILRILPFRVLKIMYEKFR
ncbi:glycosyltransferase [Citrobacter freundii]|uniref:glycosyltransferase n=1 Tax=Citrobacter freundii TaxID=546 RepID=UPI001785357E|nr:glycosyltransferase [Citrobacter freundii]MBD9990826.1 glycosyltransferase [Citrobacter freundii]MBE0055587.1 glycosyltransferase [Citrobacter freundii]